MLLKQLNHLDIKLAKVNKPCLHQSLDLFKSHETLYDIVFIEQATVYSFSSTTNLEQIKAQGKASFLILRPRFLKRVLLVQTLNRHSSPYTGLEKCLRAKVRDN